MDKMEMFKENIFSWYTFDKNAIGIVFSNDENYKTILSKKINILSEGQNEKLDYIIFVEAENVYEQICKLLPRTTSQTKIIIVGENEYSLKNISTYPSNLELLKIKPNNKICDIKKQLQECGYIYSNTYYAFPNYDFVDMLFNKNYDIKYEQVIKYIPTFEKDKIKIFDEVKMLEEISKIDKNLLDIFANSYFIEFSQNPLKSDVNYV